MYNLNSPIKYGSDDTDMSNVTRSDVADRIDAVLVK